MGMKCCYKCPERHEACHDTCKKYIEASEENETLKEAKRKAYSLFPDWLIKKRYK